jgi:putative phosphoesterase
VTLRIGLISDTHDLLRPEAVQLLRGSDHLLHAGDICKRAVLDALEAIAPVTAVRGNNDRGADVAQLPGSVTLELAGVRIHVIHDLKQLAIDPAREGVRVVVSGHSHKPLAHERGGVLYVNPGSAGPRRFSLPIAVGELLLDGRGSVEARILQMQIGR